MYCELVFDVYWPLKLIKVFVGLRPKLPNNNNAFKIHKHKMEEAKLIRSQSGLRTLNFREQFHLNLVFLHDPNPLLPDM